MASEYPPAGAAGSDGPDEPPVVTPTRYRPGGVSRSDATMAPAAVSSARSARIGPPMAGGCTPGSDVIGRSSASVSLPGTPESRTVQVARRSPPASHVARSWSAPASVPARQTAPLYAGSAPSVASLGSCSGTHDAAGPDPVGVAAWAATRAGRSAPRMSRTVRRATAARVAWRGLPGASVMVIGRRSRPGGRGRRSRRRSDHRRASCRRWYLGLDRSLRPVVGRAVRSRDHGTRACGAGEVEARSGRRGGRSCHP